MTHNDFDFYEDLIRPLMRFLCQINILQTYEDDSDCEKEEPSDTPRKQQRPGGGTENSTKIDGSAILYNSARSNPEQESQQLKFGEEFFIPPSLKQQYLKRAADAETQSNNKLNFQSFIE